MKTQYLLLFVRDGEVLSHAEFPSIKAAKEVRFSLAATCGLELQVVERVSYMEDEWNDMIAQPIPLDGEFDPKNDRF